LLARNKLIGRRVKVLLAEKEIMQKELGEYLGLRSSSISRYLSGESSFQLSHIRDMADLFHVSPQWLLGESEDREAGRCFKIPRLHYNGEMDREDVMYSKFKHEFYMISDSQQGRIIQGDFLFFDICEEYEHGDLIAIKDEGVFVGKLAIVNNTFVVTKEDTAISRHKNHADVLGKVVCFVGDAKNGFDK